MSATKTRQYHPESRTRVTISEAATRGYSTVAPPMVNIQPIRAFLPAFNARLLDHGEYRPRCINVRHADGHSRAAPTCSDTRVAAGLHPSSRMCVEDRLPGSGIWIGTKEPCSAEDHRNRDQHRNDAGSSLGLTKTHFPHHRSNSWMTNSRATYKMPFVTTGPACGHTWSTDQCRRDITGG